MADRTAQRATSTSERQPPVSPRSQRRAAATKLSPTQALQQRLGNRGTQALISRTLPSVQAETGTARRNSSVVAEPPAPSIPAQAPVSGTISEPISQREVPTPSSSEVTSTSSNATPQGPSRAPGTEGTSSSQTVIVEDDAVTAESQGSLRAPGDESSTSQATGPSNETPAQSPSDPSESPPAASEPASETEGPEKATKKGDKKEKQGKVDKKADAKKAAVPNARTAIGPAARAVGKRAAGAQKHSTPGGLVSSAQDAAKIPETERTRGAARKTVSDLETAKEGASEVDRTEFKTKLTKAIEAATPKPTSESEAEKVMKTGATTASQTLRGSLTTERDAAVGPLKTVASTEVSPAEQEPLSQTEVELEQVGDPPAPVSARSVVPAPMPSEQLDYSSDRASTDQLMMENDVSKEQLAQGNEPAFGPTLESRATAEQHEAQVEARYRQSETNMQVHAQGTAQEALAEGLIGVHGTRAAQIGQVTTQQNATKDKDAIERQRITDTIDSIKNKTKEDVLSILKEMETEATNVFEAGLTLAEKAYEDAFEEAKGGIGAWLKNWGDDWKDHIEQSLSTAREKYLDEVDKAIDLVANCVDNKLEAAKQRVADGRKEVEKFVDDLDASVKKFGEEALEAVSADFDTMLSEIDQRRDGLINKLTQQYKASYERMSAMEERLRSENKSLWERVYDATVGLVKKIIEFKNMLLGVLGKAAAVISDIIAHPIRFLGNLVSGVMQGLNNFMSKIGVHLQKGLMDWLFGALAGAGLQLPDKFDLQGIISIVLQILGLTYANFRARAVAIVGEPVVAAIEKTAEVFKVIVTEGVPGLWRFIKEKLTDLKSMVLDAIFDFIKERVIMAGITWIIGLLNPASAFFKACKAIYDIVMFFVTRGRQILTLVNAVVDSISAIAKGAVGAAAAYVENALAKAIPVAIGFLASLLGLGDPSKPVRGFIEKARGPVNKAIDWVIGKALKLVKAAGKLIGIGKEPPKEKEEDEESKDVKQKAGRDIGTKLDDVSGPDEIRAVLTATLNKFRPEGLQSLEAVVDDSGNIRVIAVASPGNEVGGGDVLPDITLRPRDLGLRYGTMLLATLNGVPIPPDGRFDATKAGGHAEVALVNALKANWEALRKPGKNVLVVRITRSPCDPCHSALQAVINELNPPQLELFEAEPFAVDLRMMSDYRGKAKFDDNVEIFKRLRAAGIKLSPWAVIEELEKFGIEEISPEQQGTIERRVQQVEEVIDASDVKVI